jgi:hypothetical protein
MKPHSVLIRTCRWIAHTAREAGLTTGSAGQCTLILHSLSPIQAHAQGLQAENVKARRQIRRVLTYQRSSHTRNVSYNNSGTNSHYTRNRRRLFSLSHIRQTFSPGSRQPTRQDSNKQQQVPQNQHRCSHSGATYFRPVRPTRRGGGPFQNLEVGIVNMTTYNLFPTLLAL